MTLENSNLFKSVKVGPVTLKNRVVHAPTSRSRVTIDHIPTDSMLKYYEERAENNGGLIIMEGALVEEEFTSQLFFPSWSNEKTVDAMKIIVDAVHKQGTSISAQLLYIGRMANLMMMKKNADGKYDPIYAASPIFMDDQQKKDFDDNDIELKELSIDQIKKIVKNFAETAKKAVNESGFDFVEIHGAHMTLIDQFIQPGSNKRSDQYGGSIENRARIVLEIVDALTEAIGANRVGIKFSPYMKFMGGEGEDSEINPIVTWGYILGELQKRANEGKELAYISVVEPRSQLIPTGEVENKIDMSWARFFWKGILIRNGGYVDPNTIDKLEDVVNGDDKLLIGIGRHYSSNPDLVEKLKKGYELTNYERESFYTPMTNKGYLGFAKYGEERDTSKDDVVPKPLV